MINENCKNCCYCGPSEDCEGWWKQNECEYGKVAYFESHIIHTVPQWKFTEEDLELFKTYCKALRLNYKDMLKGLIYNEEWYMRSTVNCVNNYFDGYFFNHPEIDRVIPRMKYGEKIE